MSRFPQRARTADADRSGKPRTEERARVSIRLPASLWKRTQITAIRRGVNAQDIIAEALRLWFGKEGK